MSFSQLAELATDGTLIYPDMSPTGKQYGYDGSGNLTTVTITQYGATWIKTLTYVSGKLTATSLWVRQ